MITLLYSFIALVVFVVSGYEMFPERLQGERFIWVIILFVAELFLESFFITMNEDDELVNHIKDMFRQTRRGIYQKQSFQADGGIETTKTENDIG